MRIYDFPESISIPDRFMPWAKSYEQEISKALSDNFAHTYKPKIEDAKSDVWNELGAIFLLASVFIMVLTNFTIGFCLGIVIYWVLTLFIKYCAKKCAIRIFESISKHDVLKKCFADILNREFADAETDAQRNVVNEFFNYAIHRTYDINFKYKK